MTLFPNGYAPTGGPGPAVELAVIKARLSWQNLDYEFARRLEALMVECDGALGFGQGWRSTTMQLELFLSRYHLDPAGPIHWDGKTWSKNPDVASAAPPGLSYHESSTLEARALAADLIGDVTLLATRGPAFGLIDFGAVNHEPWHAQPMEIPHARRDYDMTLDALTAWPLPTRPAPPAPVPQPQPQPSQEDDDMGNARLVRQEGFLNVFLVGAGPALAISGELLDSYPDVPRVWQNHVPSFKAMCFQSGLNPGDSAVVIPGGVSGKFA